MLAVEFVRWWYGAGWRQLIRRIGDQIIGLTATFSISLILKTMFAPWRQIISYSDNSLVMNLRAGLDNLISRFVGFGVRTVVLITWALLLCLTALLGAAAILLWPFLPGIIVAMVIKGLLP